MSYLLFLDESGIDGKSPYEVLAGICIEDSDLWNFVQRVHEREEAHFGRRMTHGVLEMKGSKLLNNHAFQCACQMPEINTLDRLSLVKAFLEANDCVKGTKINPSVTREQFTAYGQAKLAFVQSVLDLCISFRLRAMASIVSRNAKKPQGNDFLRKDYTFLFERYFYFLDERGENTQGLIVFDELEKSKSHLLIDQMERYFTRTANGRVRSNKIIPEPFFVHSHLTTAIQVADILAYIINFGVRLNGMRGLARPELQPFVEKAMSLRYSTTVIDDNGKPQRIWGYKYLSDLRPQADRN